MKTLRIGLLLVATLVTILPRAALAGGGGGGGAICAGFATGATLQMRDSCFEGTAHFADAGATLVVRNDGHLPHTFTAVDRSFDTGMLEAGDSAEIKLESAGIIAVYCTLHGTLQGTGMAGVLIVGHRVPETARNAASAGALQSAVSSRDAALIETLMALETEVVALKAEVQGANAGLSIALALASAPGFLGALLGGVALIVTVRQRRLKESHL